MFTVEERERLRDLLVTRARGDDRIGGAALTGSAASADEDEWSDIDLALGLVPGADLTAVLADWTEMMYRDHGVLHHTDVTRRGTVYRVFLLATTLQVDLAFSPAAEFGAIAPTFRLLFGSAQEQEPARDADPMDLIGRGWLYALHARSSLARGRVWQAEHMISGVRDQVLALACLRHGLPATQGRGIDLLPSRSTAPLVATLVRSVDAAELTRAFEAAVDALLAEIRQVDPALTRRLAGPLRELARPGAATGW
jgi:predicted nucleotidyltransferase